MAEKTIKNSDEIRQFLLDACEKKELLVIITPYLKFESNFVHFDGQEVHVKTVSGGEDALNILNVSEFNLRFPSEMDHLEVTTRYIGLGTYEGSKTIRLAKPHSIAVSSGRRSPRITALENAYAVLTLKEKRKVRADVADLSHEGAKLILSVDLPHDTLETGDRIMASLFLPDDISFNTDAIVRYIEYKTIGVEFDPSIPPSINYSISRWAFKKQEIEMEHASSHADLNTKAESAKAISKDGPGNVEILFVTRDDGLDSALGGLLGQKWNYCRIPPAAGALNSALDKKPRLIILHDSNGQPAESQLVRSLSEHVPPNIPILLLGTGVDSEALIDLGRECRAISSMLWAPNKALFLQRLSLGVMRKYYSEGESPMAPAEVGA